jgi:hypothetical protein
MEKAEILHTLQEDVRTAKQRLDAAMEKFDAVIQETPSALPHPDGVHRIHNAGRALNHAREEHVQAHVRLNAFVAQGIIPDDLTKRAGWKEVSGKVKIKSSGE